MAYQPTAHRYSPAQTVGNFSAPPDQARRTTDRVTHREIGRRTVIRPLRNSRLKYERIIPSLFNWLF